MHTIITQSGLILNYRYIREIGIYDAEDDDGLYYSLISGKNDKGEDIQIAAYSTPEEGDSTFNKLTNAFVTGKEVFSFAEETVISKERIENTEPAKTGYKNRFISKDR